MYNNGSFLFSILSLTIALSFEMNHAKDKICNANFRNCSSNRTQKPKRQWWRATTHIWRRKCYASSTMSEKDTMGRILAFSSSTSWISSGTGPWTKCEKIADEVVKYVKVGEWKGDLFKFFKLCWTTSLMKKGVKQTQMFEYTRLTRIE